MAKPKSKIDEIEEEISKQHSINCDNAIQQDKKNIAIQNFAKSMIAMYAMLVIYAILFVASVLQSWYIVVVSFVLALVALIAKITYDWKFIVGMLKK